MKVKLLKKIRKRYEIIKVEKLSADADSLWEATARDIGLPFYLLCDNDSPLGIRFDFYKSYELARKDLVEWIHNDYEAKIKHPKGKTKKVWWVKNQYKL